MKSIVTLTLNPSVDGAWDVDDVIPVRKMRASEGRADPGGGGINVSRVISILGGKTTAVYLAGGMSGEFLQSLLTTHDIDARLIPIDGPTRICIMVFERSSGQEFRVVPPGPEVTQSDLERCLNTLSTLDADYLVATGSLPRGVPRDFYAHLARLAKARGVRVVLDTSGRPLFEALKEGVYLAKPNLPELQNLMGRKTSTPQEEEDLAAALVDEGKAEIVALSLGEDGAILAWKGGRLRLASPKVEVRSAVGAGDSFVGAMTLGLAQGHPVEEAFALGVATGAATVMTTGTQLCHRDDVDRLFAQVWPKQTG